MSRKRRRGDAAGIWDGAVEKKGKGGVSLSLKEFDAGVGGGWEEKGTEKSGYKFEKRGPRSCMASALYGQSLLLDPSGGSQKIPSLELKPRAFQ